MMSASKEYSTLPFQEGKEQHYELTATLIGTDDDSSFYMDMPIKKRNRCKNEYSNLPEAKDLTWEDTFFDDNDDDDDDDDIIAVFDFDYEGMEKYYTSVGWLTFIGASLVYSPFLIFGLIGLVPCYLQQNVQWNTRAQHVVVTRDGIRFVRNKRQCCWGMSCTDQGKRSKTVPFDKITDCDIQEPAGNTCLVIPEILTTVALDTASSGEKSRELKIVGLKHPHALKKLVWAMKRKNNNNNNNIVVNNNDYNNNNNNNNRMLDTRSLLIGTPKSTNIEQENSSNIIDNNVHDTTTKIILCEIRDELRQNNELMRQIMIHDQNPPPPETTAMAAAQVVTPLAPSSL